MDCIPNLLTPPIDLWLKTQLTQEKQTHTYSSLYKMDLDDVLMNLEHSDVWPTLTAGTTR